MSASDDASARRRAAILPREAGAAPLDLVIGVMAFLAALALGGVLIAKRTAESWQAGLVGRLDGADPAARRRARPTRSQCRRRHAARDAGRACAPCALSEAEALALVEPWLGRDAVVAALPFPAPDRCDAGARRRRSI